MIYSFPIQQSSWHCSLKSLACIFLIILPQGHFFTVFRKREREKRKERNIEVRKKHHMHLDLALNMQPGTYLDQEPNLQPFGYRTTIQPTEPHWPGLWLTFSFPFLQGCLLELAIPFWFPPTIWITFSLTYLYLNCYILIFFCFNFCPSLLPLVPSQVMFPLQYRSVNSTSIYPLIHARKAQRNPSQVILNWQHIIHLQVWPPNLGTYNL